MEDEAAATSLREKPIIEPPPKKAGAVEDNTRLTETFAGHKDVPESVLSQIELRSLSLAYNNLTAIRSPISRLTNLTRLVVDHNNVARIASKISCLVNLQELGMANNLLTSLPNTSMIHLTLLQSLDLSFNRLQEFPECIIHLTSLRKLDLSRNSGIKEVPGELGHLSLLTQLSLSHIGLRELPAKSIGSMIHLKVINLSGNFLTDLPKTFKRLTQLESIDLSYNEFVDTPAPLLRGFEQLQFLTLVGNVQPLTVPKQINVVTRSTYAPEPSLILPGLYLGCQHSARNKVYMRTKNIRRVLMVITTIQPPYPDDFIYHVITVEDEDKTDLYAHFASTFAFINAAIEAGESVLVHCAAGISRSATIVTAYVMKTQNKTYEEALAYVIERRPVVCPNAGFREQLQRYEASLKASGCSVM